MSVDDVQLDVLVSGEEPGRRRRAAGVVLVVVLVLGLAIGWYADHRSRQGEYAAVSRCAADSAREYRESTARLSAMAEYVRPSLVFATEQTARGLYGMVSHEAEGISGELQQLRDRCAALDVLGWHSSQRAALSAQLAVQDAEVALLARTATQGLAYYEGRDQVSALRSAAAVVLAGARPTTPW